MSDLYFLSYNNYFNRKLKRETTLAAYLSAASYYDVFSNRQFNPNNGLTSTHIENLVTETYDYLLVCDSTTIVSRWFITQTTRTRNGQYSFSLQRDLKADYYDKIMNSPCLIEKATLQNDDPFIFNKEGGGYNQIKMSETLLRDKSKCAWIVGYIPRDSFPTDTVVSVPAQTFTNYQTFADATAYPWAINPNEKINATIFFKIHSKSSAQIGEKIAIALLFDGEKLSFSSNIAQDNGYHYSRISSYKGLNYPNVTGVTSRKWDGQAYWGPYISYLTTDLNPMWKSMIPLAFPEVASQNISAWTDLYNSSAFNSFVGTSNTVTDFSIYNGKVIYNTAEAKYYKVNVKKSIVSFDNSVTSAGLEASIQALMNITNLSSYGFTGTASQIELEVRAISYQQVITLTELETEQYQVAINASTTRRHDASSPYDVFAIPYILNSYEDEPYGLVMAETSGVPGGTYLNANNKIALDIANQISIQSGSSNIFDLQLLPYCPIPGALYNSDTYTDWILSVLSLDRNKDYDYVQYTADNTVKTILFWVSQSQFDVDLNYSITVEDKKESNELDLYRICSPNYSSVFEFSPAKNNGVLFFRASCTYKPYNPFIIVSPSFAGLYGGDYYDQRGLVLAGDFSLPIVSSAWANYQLNNKNYLNTFNRQITTLELTQKYSKIGDIVGAASGTVSGAVSGAIVGGVPGAVAGGIASAAGGVADVIINENLRKNQLSETKDLFNYSLQNIQALPQTIAQSSAINSRSKYIPFLEYYTCSQEERLAFRAKLKWTGMTVNRVGYIPDYFQTGETYIQARPLRLVDIECNQDVAMQIFNELANGFYIGDDE